MENTPTRWQRLAALSRQFVATSHNGRMGVRLLCALTLAVGLVLPQAQAQSGTGSITGRVLNLGNSRYVANAVVTVEGTNLQTLTTEYGEYRINGVPAGEVKVKVVSGGLDSETASVTVTAGGQVNHDFSLTSAERYGEDKTVQLDTFVVAANREFEGNAIATNEQRFAKGLKVVMASDAFGDVTEGNAGEFLKFLPGVSVDYVAADVRTVSVRGFAAGFTNVYMDGMPVTSSNSGAAGRQFEFEQVSINNAARVEVLKVPTPDIPMNGIGGNINLVSKSSLERKGSQFNYRVGLSLNNEDLKIGKTPGPRDEDSHKVLPGFDFDYTLQVSPNFGIVITGLSSSQFNEQHRWQTVWNYQQGGGSIANPMMQTAQLQDGPKFTDRQSGSIKADWRISDNQRLSVMVQDSYYHSFFGNRNLNFDIGTTTTTAAAGGRTLTFGPTFSQSATGTFSATDPYGNRGRVTQGSSFRDKYGNTAAANARYTYTGPKWDLEAGAHGAKSRTWYRVLGRGHFANIGTRMVGVADLRVDNIAFPSHTFVARNAGGVEIDPYNLNNYRITTLTDDPIDGVAQMKGGYVDIGRDISLGATPLTIKFGSRIYEESKDNRRATRQWNFVGADGVANTADDNAGAFKDANYSQEDPYWGSRPIEWINSYALAEAFATNPAWFSENAVVSEQFRLNNSEKITETITAYYAQLEGKFMNNRLQIVAGARFEKTKDEGEGVLNRGTDVLFEHNADGSLRDGDPTLAGIQYVRTAAAGPAGTAGTSTSTSGLTATQVPSGTVRATQPFAFTNLTLQELALTTIERGSKPVRSYDHVLPGISAVYNIKENLLLRVGWAKTIGRPDYTNILPFTTVDDNEVFDIDPTVSPGTLTTRNTGLRPWKADNFDLSLEYYFAKNGLLTVGAFQKNIDGFFQPRTGTVDAALAQELGIGSEFIGWGVSTLINGGDSKISGLEFNFVRQLDFLPWELRNLSISANATKLELEGANTGAFANFIPKTGNVAISWNKKPVAAQIKFNYRGRQQLAAQTGAQYGAANGFYGYYEARWNVDLNFEYTFSKRLKVFANARNIFNKEQLQTRYSEAMVSAIYAQGFQLEEFGIQMAVGVKGTF